MHTCNNNDCICKYNDYPPKLIKFWQETTLTIENCVLPTLFMKAVSGVLYVSYLTFWFVPEKLGYDCFRTVTNTMQNYHETILNYFVNRETNAFAESFNAKIKAFRAQFRGVRDIPFFIFRLNECPQFPQADDESIEGSSAAIYPCFYDHLFLLLWLFILASMSVEA